MEIPKITSTSWGRKELLTLSAFQDPISLSRRQDTFSDSKVTFGLISLNDSGVGSHLSVQISSLSPFPITHLDPTSTISLAAIILHQMYDGLLLSWASLKVLSTKYFAFRTLWTRELVFCCILHPCLARRARLNALRSLNPMPPSSLGVHSFSHVTQAIFLSLSFCPHQKLPIIEFNSLQSESGNLKQLIVYVEVAWAIALIRISLPTHDRSFPFHPNIFLSTWSLIRLNAFLLPFPTKGGRPRYLSWCWMTWLWKSASLGLGHPY